MYFMVEPKIVAWGSGAIVDAQGREVARVRIGNEDPDLDLLEFRAARDAALAGLVPGGEED